MPHKEEIDQSKTASTILNYHHPSEDGATSYLGTAKDKLRVWEPHPVQIRDIRSTNDKFTLDRNGFEFVQRPTVFKNFDDEEQTKEQYHAECAELVKEITGATHVHIIGHAFRKQKWDDVVADAKKVKETEGELGFVQSMNPATHVHVDQSYSGAKVALETQLKDSAQRLMKTRWAIINLWRPLKPVRRDPLALCDWQTLPESDFREVTLVFPTKDQHSAYGQATGAPPPYGKWEMAYNPKHEWWYASDMTPDECWFIKCFDSKKDGRARLTAHTAFVTDKDEGPARESVEVRCLVFWEDQEAE